MPEIQIPNVEKPRIQGAKRTSCTHPHHASQNVRAGNARFQHIRYVRENFRAEVTTDKNVTTFNMQKAPIRQLCPHTALAEHTAQTVSTKKYVEGVLRDAVDPARRVSCASTSDELKKKW